MEMYGKILNIAMPIFLGLVLLEKLYGWYAKKAILRIPDMISSMSSGYTNVIKDVLGLSVSLITYDWMLAHLSVYTVQSTLWTYIIAFIALDFSGYWVHRLSHEINFFWNKHLVHHSSEEFDLACALRQSISSFVNLFTFFLLPAALLGVPSSVIAIVAPLHLFAQFWYHTEYIRTMGFLEHIIVTPAHHRVHHAVNPAYLDKNYGQIFIFWDKLFGTFQEELADTPAVYGITRAVRTWNPIKINFQHLFLLAQDAWRAENWGDKFRVWYMPTGWRPTDVAARYPIKKIEDIYNFEKYAPKNSPLMMVWSVIQFLFTFSLIVYLFAHLVQIGTPNIFLYGCFIFLSVFSYTELMDRNPYAFAWEAAKNALGLYLIYTMGDWFGMTREYGWTNIALPAYFILATAITGLFVWFDIKQKDVFFNKTYS